MISYFMALVMYYVLRISGTSFKECVFFSFLVLFGLGFSKIFRIGDDLVKKWKILYIVGENAFPQYIVDKPVNMCITKTKR